MEFIFETIHDTYTMSAVAKVLRKLFRRKQSLITRLLCIALVTFGVYKAVPFSGDTLSFSPASALSYIALLLLLLIALFEDTVNGFFAQKRIGAGRLEITTTFFEEHYCLQSDVDTTNWQYRDVNILVETKHFFLIVFNERYAQIFDKYTLSGGTEEEFRVFIQGKTGKTIRKL